MKRIACLLLMAVTVQLVGHASPSAPQRKFDTFGGAMGTSRPTVQLAADPVREKPRVKFPPEEVWKLLWDGKTLNGWHVIGKGEWKTVDGAIHATHSKSVAEFGHLVTDKVYKDFTVRLHSNSSAAV